MKLPSTLVQHISTQVVKGLVKDDQIRMGDPAAAVQVVADAISEDLMVEDRLNDEVREILRSYSDEMTRTGVQYHEMFKIVKNELVRKRKLIL